MEFSLCSQCYFRTQAKKRMCQTCGHVRAKQEIAQILPLTSTHAPGDADNILDVMARLQLKFRTWIQGLEEKMPLEVPTDVPLEK